MDDRDDEWLSALQKKQITPLDLLASATEDRGLYEGSVAHNYIGQEDFWQTGHFEVASFYLSWV